MEEGLTLELGDGVSIPYSLVSTTSTTCNVAYNTIPPGPVHLRPHPPHPRTATFLFDRRVINVLPRLSFHSSARINGLSSRNSARAMGVSHDLCTMQALANVLTGSRKLAKETNMKRRSELSIPTCPVDLAANCLAALSTTSWDGNGVWRHCHNWLWPRYARLLGGQENVKRSNIDFKTVSSTPNSII
ncbi:hypothetical protein BO85DRAFT_191955 [Aspergillus piperis CBS 112811]|uniref:Uncharacterized protein n=1 Tax=Aspergillus piperis CBS 112811 TaxID=1448313 RepID=A0A8G1R800_9EURO|nr:hypothetical protein BO85DRAFT_191955 [Aspergillus piperis CBS 112811]RAH61258.1 hypothetical protein BO85DRAFT_191955 [Aspergillus piperis CBS 112811]